MTTFMEDEDDLPKGFDPEKMFSIKPGARKMEMDWLPEMLLEFPDPLQLYRLENKEENILVHMRERQWVQRQNLIQRHAKQMQDFRSDLTKQIDLDVFHLIDIKNMVSQLHPAMVKQLQRPQYNTPPYPLDKLPADKRLTLINLNQYNPKREAGEMITRSELESYMGDLIFSFAKQLEVEDKEMRFFHQDEQRVFLRFLAKGKPPGNPRTITKQPPDPYPPMKPDGAFDTSIGSRPIIEPRGRKSVSFQVDPNRPAESSIQIPASRADLVAGSAASRPPFGVPTQRRDSSSYSAVDGRSPMTPMTPVTPITPSGAAFDSTVYGRRPERVVASRPSKTEDLVHRGLRADRLGEAANENLLENVHEDRKLLHQGSLDTDGTEPRVICNHLYKWGECNFGDACHFSHELPRPDEDPNTYILSGVARHSKGVCTRWSATGRCTYGDTCRFADSHEAPRADNDLRAFTSSRRTGSLDEGPQLFVQRAFPPPGRIICNFFSKFQTCKYGKKCTYSHELPLPFEDPRNYEYSKAGGDKLGFRNNAPRQGTARRGGGPPKGRGGLTDRSDNRRRSPNARSSDFDYPQDMDSYGKRASGRPDSDYAQSPTRRDSSRRDSDYSPDSGNRDIGGALRNVDIGRSKRNSLDNRYRDVPGSVRSSVSEDSYRDRRDSHYSGDNHNYHGKSSYRDDHYRGRRNSNDSDSYYRP